MDSHWREHLRSVRDDLRSLRSRVVDAECGASSIIAGVHPSHRSSARNLVHYLALRREDPRELQEALRRLGLSSLGRCEPCVMATLNAVLSALGSMLGEEPEGLCPEAPVTLEEADRLLARNGDALLGTGPPGRHVRIMVTMPTEAAWDRTLIEALLGAGMNVARINAARDTPEDWASMVSGVRSVAAALGTDCRVLVDLPGVKLRTGAIGERKHLLLHPGQTLVLTTPDEPGAEPLRGASGAEVRPARIPCATPAVFGDVRVGDRVFFDDGRLGGVARRVSARCVEVEITRARPGGEKLRPDRGINLPDTALSLPTLGPGDEAVIAFAGAHADMIGLSFVRRPEDVDGLRARLGAVTDREVGIVLKIETAAAFDGLAGLLVAAMRSACCGVMIARGDLAVEIGDQRLAEAQEEIMWLSEAAHAPVIWATQVLDTLAKKGRATRAEITDAAMSERAECVMLNKGRFILRAVETLDGILGRMGEHQLKKRSLMRPLHVASRFFEG